MPNKTNNTQYLLQDNVILTTENILLSDDADYNGKDNNTPRTFSGLANSGKPFLNGGVKSIIDFSTLTFKDKIPALDSHNRDKRAGIAELTVTDDGLMVKGNLLANEYGNAIAADADQGFPWELSVHVQAGNIEEIADGKSVEVNGQIYNEEMVILRQGKIREVSFTPTGVDDSTHAAILSDDKATESTDAEPKTLAEALLKIKALAVENTRLKKENEKLKAIESKAKIDAKLATAGFLKDIYGNFKGVSKQSYNVLLSLSDVQADAMIKDLSQSQVKPVLPDYLLSETTVSSGNNQGKSDDKIDQFLQEKGVYR